MADNITFDFEALDFESAVDEVDIIVPKYLEALENLEKVKDLDEVPFAIQNVIVYWERLDLLFRQIEPLEQDVPIRQILTDTLQSELAVLEHVYLGINLRIQFREDKWSEGLWKAAEIVLNRMDRVLEGLGFDAEHEDRLLIAELSSANMVKHTRWGKQARQAS